MPVPIADGAPKRVKSDELPPTTKQDAVARLNLAEEWYLRKLKDDGLDHEIDHATNVIKLVLPEAVGPTYRARCICGGQFGLARARDFGKHLYSHRTATYCTCGRCGCCHAAALRCCYRKMTRICDLWAVSVMKNGTKVSLACAPVEAAPASVTAGAVPGGLDDCPGSDSTAPLPIAQALSSSSKIALVEDVLPSDVVVGAVIQPQAAETAAGSHDLEPDLAVSSDSPSEAAVGFSSTTALASAMFPRTDSEVTPKDQLQFILDSAYPRLFEALSVATYICRVCSSPGCDSMKVGTGNLRSHLDSHVASGQHQANSGVTLHGPVRFQPSLLSFGFNAEAVEPVAHDPPAPFNCVAKVLFCEGYHKYEVQLKSKKTGQKRTYHPMKLIYDFVRPFADVTSGASADDAIDVEAVRPEFVPFPNGDPLYWAPHFRSASCHPVRVIYVPRTESNAGDPEVAYYVCGPCGKLDKVRSFYMRMYRVANRAEAGGTDRGLRDFGEAGGNPTQPEALDIIAKLLEDNRSLTRSLRHFKDRATTLADKLRNYTYGSSDVCINSCVCLSV